MIIRGLASLIARQPDNASALRLHNSNIKKVGERLVN